jgi:hypothetical protein
VARTIERTPDGRRVCVRRTVAATRESAWEVLTDTETWPEWGPSVSAVESSDRVIREGTTGRVRTPVGISLPFEITSCRDYRWTWEVAKIPATGHRVDAVEEPTDGEEYGEKCRVVFEVPLLAAGYVPVCQRALGRIEAILSE